MPSSPDAAARRSVVVMVEPITFFCNEATCEDNYFQNRDESEIYSFSDTAEGKTTKSVGNVALNEHRMVYEALKSRAIETKLYRLSEEKGLGEVNEASIDGSPSSSLLSTAEQLAMLATKPDAIFPNNSISFHELTPTVAGSIRQKAGPNQQSEPTLAAILYPMCPGRRNEIPKTLLEKVKRLGAVTVTPTFVGEGPATEPTSWGLTYTANDGNSADEAIVLIDFRAFQNVPRLIQRSASLCGSNKETMVAEGTWWALEGTGSVNYSAEGDAVFATASQRCHPIPFHLLCEVLGIETHNRFLIPRAVDPHGRCVYHTNVVGWVGDCGISAWTREALDFTPPPFANPSLYATEAAFASAVGRGNTEAGVCGPPPCSLTLDYKHLMGFAGNALYLRNHKGTAYVAMSHAAATAMGNTLLGQLNAALEKASLSSAEPQGDTPGQLYPHYSHIIACPISTIERLGGGSVRCLLAATLSLTDAGYERLRQLI